MGIDTAREREHGLLKWGDAREKARRSLRLRAPLSLDAWLLQYTFHSSQYPLQSLNISIKSYCTVRLIVRSVPTLVPPSFSLLDPLPLKYDEQDPGFNPGYQPWPVSHSGGARGIAVRDQRAKGEESSEEDVPLVTSLSLSLPLPLPPPRPFPLPLAPPPFLSCPYTFGSIPLHTHVLLSPTHPPPFLYLTSPRTSAPSPRWSPPRCTLRDKSHRT
jgi:hypothetical protein